LSRIKSKSKQPEKSFEPRWIFEDPPEEPIPFKTTRTVTYLYTGGRGEGNWPELTERYGSMATDDLSNEAKKIIEQRIKDLEEEKKLNESVGKKKKEK
jgi:hypothetical protein